jgi:hypothetical protein
MDGVADAFSALRGAAPRAALAAPPAAPPPPPPPLSPAEAAASGAAALAAAAAAPPPRDALPVATGDVVAGLEALFRRLLVPSDAALRAGARLIAPERLARMARFSGARMVAALEEWEGAAGPAGRARAEAALEAINDVRRRFLAAVLGAGGAHAMAALLVADAARGDGAAAAAAAAARVAPELSPPQAAALLAARDAYRAAVKEARRALRAALARAADAAAPPPGADAAHLVAHLPPAGAAAATALDAAAAAAAAHAAAEAEALVALAAALTAALSPLAQARVQRAFGPWAVDMPALVEAFADFWEAA